MTNNSLIIEEMYKKFPVFRSNPNKNIEFENQYKQRINELFDNENIILKSYEEGSDHITGDIDITFTFSKIKTL